MWTMWTVRVGSPSRATRKSYFYYLLPLVRCMLSYQPSEEIPVDRATPMWTVHICPHCLNDLEGVPSFISHSKRLRADLPTSPGSIPDLEENEQK
jgi:hypothetical protein